MPTTPRFKVVITLRDYSKMEYLVESITTSGNFVKLTKAVATVLDNIPISSATECAMIMLKDDEIVTVFVENGEPIRLG